jgi:hypothetical protein
MDVPQGLDHQPCYLCVVSFKDTWRPSLIAMSFTFSTLHVDTLDMPCMHDMRRACSANLKYEGRSTENTMLPMRASACHPVHYVNLQGWPNFECHTAGGLKHACVPKAVLSTGPGHRHHER